MIDPTTKRAIGQMIKGVQVVGAAHDGVVRGYCSHWITQVAFEEPLVMASVSPKHDTHPLMVASGAFSVSILAGDQVDVGQYFSYPGRRFRYVAAEYLELVDGLPVVPGCLAWLRCETFQRMPMGDHELFFARVTKVGAGRLGAPPAPLLRPPRLARHRREGPPARRLHPRPPPRPSGRGGGGDRFRARRRA